MATFVLLTWTIIIVYKKCHVYMCVLLEVEKSTKCIFHVIYDKKK